MKTKNILEQNINTLKKYFEKYKNKEKSNSCTKTIAFNNIIKNNNIDSNRIYSYGCSAGGY